MLSAEILMKPSATAVYKIPRSFQCEYNISGAQALLLCPHAIKNACNDHESLV